MFIANIYKYFQLKERAKTYRPYILFPHSEGYIGITDFLSKIAGEITADVA